MSDWHPTKPGFYAVRCSGHTTVCQVAQDMTVWFIGSEDSCTIPEVRGEWFREFMLVPCEFVV
jgi:hypothetical protein